MLTNVALGQQPKLMLPIGHTGWVLTASFSPDGKYIVTASWDGTAKIWNAASGQLVTDLKGHKNSVSGASFSPDGKYIVTSSYDNTARIWNAINGQFVTELKGHTGWVCCASFCSSGKYIVTGSQDNTAKIWNALSGQLVANLKGHTKRVSFASFSPNGEYVVTASEDNTARVWNAKTGQLIKELKGHTGSVRNASFSPDGKYIVTASGDSTAKVWNAFNGQLVAELKGHTNEIYRAAFSADGKFIVTASGDKTARVWNAFNGQLIAELKGHTNEVYAASFSPDGKYIVTASGDKTAKVWYAMGGQLIADLKKHVSLVYSASFSADGKYIVTGSYDNTAKVWNAKSGQLVEDLKGHTNKVNSASFSPDGKFTLTAYFDGTAKVWNTISGQLVAILKGHKNVINTASFSPACPDDPVGGKYIVTASFDSTAKVWNAMNGQLVADMRGHTGSVINASFSADAKYIVTTSRDSTAKVWNVFNGQLVADLKGHTSPVHSASFSPDGKYIVTATSSIPGDTIARIWNVLSGQLIADLKGHTEELSSASFSPACPNDPIGGKYIVTTSYDSTAKVWNAFNGQPVTDLKGHTNEVYSASFSPDGKYIVTASADSTAKVWNAFNGQLIADLKGHTSSVSGASFSPDGKYIVTVGSNDNTAKIWNADSWLLTNTIEGNGGRFGHIDFKNKRISSVFNSELSIYDLETGKMLYTFFTADSSDYLVYDKDNRYDGTPAARKLLYFTCGTEIIELEQVKDQLWVPNLAERIMKGDSVNAKKLEDLNLCGLSPEVEDVSSKESEFRFSIKARRGGLGETVVFVNGIEARRYKPGELKKTGEAYELLIRKEELSNYFIAGKENPVIIKAYTSDNAISSRGLKITEDKTKEASAPPNLYAVMIGISNYKGEELDLKYADKDATDISNAISVAAKKLLNYGDGKEHVFIYNLTTATEHYLLPEKISIKKLLGEIGAKATANDILLIFFAGHGMMEGQKKQFYFLTADASQASITGAVADVGISTAELTEWMKPQNIKAQKRILIFDACNSGQAINDFVKMGKDDQGYLAARNDDKSQQIKAIDKLNEKSGLFILSASASNQNAYEMGRYSQGLLTYSLLKAIKQKPDILNEGKYLDVSRWFNAAKESVSDLVKESGAMQEPQIVTNTNFNIGVVDEEVMAKIILPMEKPLFTSSNFQNSDENNPVDNLGLNKLIDRELNIISASGTDAPIVYAGTTSSADAYTLSGRYSITNDLITIKVFIIQNKEVKQKIDMVGRKEKLDEFAAQIAAKTSEWASKNK